MLFSYYFTGDKIDVAKFRKQAAKYIVDMQEVSFHIFLPHYKMVLETATMPNSTAHILTAQISDLRRRKDGTIEREEAIFPLLDNRFKENEEIKKIFTVLDNYRGSVSSKDVNETIDRLCRIIKLLYKLDHLKAFI